MNKKEGFVEFWCDCCQKYKTGWKFSAYDSPVGDYCFECAIETQVFKYLKGEFQLNLEPDKFIDLYAKGKVRKC